MKRPRPRSYHPISLGPVSPRMQLGDSITLENGLDITLVYIESRVPIFRARPEGSWHQMWTVHMDRPGLYIHAGEWPRGPKAIFDTDKAIAMAMDVQLVAENFVDIDEVAPRGAGEVE